MDLKPKHLRITNYNKLNEKFITVQIKPSKKEKGILYAIIEILCPWNPNAQIGQSIINTLSREYNKTQNSNELINFENSLKKVNERLVQITQNGETDWIGKINAALILIKNKKIHIAYTGKIRAYLLRSKKLLPIINHKENYTYHHPLKTFSNVVSGQLKLDDKIFFSTNQLFNYIDSKKLEKILSESDINTDAIQIANILKSRNLNTANSLLIKMQDYSSSDESENETIYLDEQKFSYIIQSTKNFFNKTGNLFSKWTKSASDQFDKSKDYYNKKILPKTKKAWDKTKEFTNSNKHLKKITQQTNPFANKFKNKKTTSKKTDNLNINHYSTSTKKISIIGKKILDWLQSNLRKTQHFLKTAFSAKNRSKTYIIIAGVLFIIFIANIGYLQNINKNKEINSQIEQEINDLDSKVKDANLAILTGDKEKAQQLLSEVTEQLSNYENYPNFKDQLESLKNQISELSDKIANIERLTQSQEINKFENCEDFYLIDKQIYCINSQTNGIFKTTENSDNSPDEIALIPNSAGNYQKAGILENQLIILTSNQQVFKLTNDNLNELNIESGSWPNATSIASFYNNLYFLDSSVGQIYKMTPNENNYKSPAEYLEDNSDLTNSVDITIDGSIYVLKNDGQIIKLSLGQQESFEIRNIPEPNTNIINPKKIYTTEDLDSLFVLADNRIIELSKDGDFKNQYNFDKDKQNITDFNINTKAREIYILNDNILYKYNY